MAGAYIAIYSTFLGMAMLGFVIDFDHWRLFWMLLGLVWGLTIATRAQAPPPSSGNRRRRQPNFGLMRFLGDHFVIPEPRSPKNP